MSRRRRMIDVVLARPGSTLREIVTALGLTPKRDGAGVSAQISQLCKAGLLRKDAMTSAGNASLRYWPTPDMPRAATARPADDEAKRAARRQRDAERKRQQRAAARGAAPMRKPARASQIVVAATTARMLERRTGTAPETVDEFLARGGRIQRLPPTAVSRSDLRFDHSDNHAPRLPITRARPHPAHA